MKSRGYDLVESHLFKDLYKDTFHLNDLSKKVSFLNRTFVFKKTECVDINDVLRWCPIVDDILNFNNQILQKYKKTLTDKINNSENNKDKHEYKFVRDNLTNTPSIIEQPDIPQNVKKYMSYIYNEYLNDLK